MWRRYPYKSDIADAYVTAINILAVEYLVKQEDEELYGKRCKQVNELTDEELVCLNIHLSLNMHTSSLGAMITQGDYDYQKEELLYFLDHPEDRL